MYLYRGVYFLSGPNMAGKMWPNHTESSHLLAWLGRDIVLMSDGNRIRHIAPFIPMNTGNEIFFLSCALSFPPMLNLAEPYEALSIKPTGSRSLQRHIATAVANRLNCVLYDYYSARQVFDVRRGTWRMRGRPAWRLLARASVGLRLLCLAISPSGFLDCTLDPPGHNTYGPGLNVSRLVRRMHAYGDEKFTRSSCRFSFSKASAASRSSVMEAR